MRDNARREGASIATDSAYLVEKPYFFPFRGASPPYNPPGYIEVTV
jgi:hypothetical protein